MKVTLYMATTVNGFIAKNNDDTSWISKEEWNSYSRMVRAAGNLIVGHRTYDILTKQPEFSELKEVRLVVVAHELFQTLAENHTIALSPKDALAVFKDEKEVVVAGGGILNASFLEEDLVDEIYVDIEPRLFGKGIPLVNGVDFEKKLEFIASKQITENEIQLHYRVVK